MLPLLLLALPDSPVPVPDLTGYRTPKAALRADPKAFASTPPARRPGYAGIEVGEQGGAAVVGAVDGRSPSAAAGLQPGDRIDSLDGTPTPTPAALKDRLRRLAADEPTTFAVQRDGQTLAITVTPTAVSRPFAPADGPGRPVLGITTRPDPDGLTVDTVVAGGAGAAAGLRVGDVLLKLDEFDLTAAGVAVRDALAQRRPGEAVALLVKRGRDELALRATLGGESATKSVGWDDRLPEVKPRTGYKLAVVGIDFPDVKHNPKVSGADWEKALFSLGQYTGRSPTGEKVFGSMADYYREVSYGRFTVTGKFVGWVEAKKPRPDYAPNNGSGSQPKRALLTEVLDKLTEKNPDALKEYEGVFFVFAGERVRTNRGGLYWPHRATVSHGGKRWPYFIVHEGGPKMTDISVFCHEFGHMLGLPDLYASPEVPGMEGVGLWCAMSQQLPGGRPQHFGAWCKERLGWLQPVTIDPRVKQRIVLAPVEDDPTECVRVPVRPDGGEYLLLENRRKKGFDSNLPGEGLLVWRVIPRVDREQARDQAPPQPVFLEEAHGIAGPPGPRSQPTQVPFPSAANTAFTPHTTPSSRAVTGGGLDVWLTDITRLPDGRITFAVGYEFQ